MQRPAFAAGAGTTGCIVLPLAMFIALMLASAGVAIWPKMAAPGAAILCGGGEVVYESHGTSYRPGEYTITRELYCRTGEGKEARRDEITFQAAGISFLLYSAIVFLLLQFIARPLLRRRVSRTLEAARDGAPAAATQLGGFLGRVAQAAARGAAAREAQPAEETGDVAGRLERLRALRDQGLITASDYEAKKAEILSRL